MPPEQVAAERSQEGDSALFCVFAIPESGNDFIHSSGKLLDWDTAEPFIGYGLEVCFGDIHSFSGLDVCLLVIGSWDRFDLRLVSNCARLLKACFNAVSKARRGFALLDHRVVEVRKEG
jgi:hypothetical protein